MAAASALALALLAPGLACAQAGSGEWSVAGGPAFALVDGVPGTGLLPLATGQVSWGWTDTVSLGTQLYAGPLFFESDAHPDRRTGLALGAFAGVGLNLDVTHIIPFGSVMAGVWRLPADASLPSPLAAIRVAVGVDWRTNRAWAWGLQVEAHVAPARIDALPAFTVVTLRLNRIFDPNAL